MVVSWLSLTSHHLEGGRTTLGLLAASPAADAPQAGKIYRIGTLSTGPPGDRGHHALLDEFRHGLREHGYTDGENIVLEHRYARGKLDLLPELLNRADQVIQ